MCQGRDKVPFGSVFQGKGEPVVHCTPACDEGRSVPETQQSDKLHGVDT